MVVPIFDFDGTLVDSDQALAGAFVALGVPAENVTFGHELAVECDRLGVAVDQYVEVYRTFRPQPFAQIDELLGGLEPWHICSNKHGPDGHRELEGLGWTPASAWFADAFDGPKSLVPLLDALDLDPADVVFVGDTTHDRACADEIGCTFVLAGWNPRALRSREPSDLVASAPLELPGLFRSLGR
jgi:phosphoglycolate phosphatase-like HAD superfamily hydrolase